MRRAGIFVVLLGISLTIFTVLTFAADDRIAYSGMVDITQKKHQGIKWSPYLGLVVIGAGFLIFFVPQKK